MLLSDTSRLITSAGRAARWPFEITNADPEAVGLVRLFMATPHGMVDLATGLVATRSGSADPGRVNADGSLDAYFDGFDDQYSFGTDGAAVAVSTAFTVVWEAELDSFSDAYAILAHFRTGLSLSPLRIFYSSDGSYDDITVGYDTTNTHAFLVPSGISRTGERHWGVWAYNGQGFPTTGNHRLWINGQDCSVTTSGSLAGSTDDNRVGGASVTTADWNGSVRQVRLYDREWAQDEAIRFWHPSSRDSLFRRPSPITFFSTSGGDIVVSGGSATSATGSLTPSLSASVDGSSITATAGALTPSVGATAAISGSSSTSAAGTLTPSVGATVALSGSVGTTATGALTASLLAGLGGSAATTAVGGLGVSGSNSAALSSSQLTSSSGSISPDLSKAIAGVQSTTVAGALTAVTGATTSLSGVTSTASKGALAATLSVTLAGAQISSAAGSLSPNLNGAIAGVQSTAAAGVLTSATGASAVLSGVQASTQAGAVAASITQAIAGVQSTTFAGALDSPTVSKALAGAQGTTTSGEPTVDVSKALAGCAADILHGELFLSGGTYTAALLGRSAATGVGNLSVFGATPVGGEIISLRSTLHPAVLLNSHIHE